MIYCKRDRLTVDVQSFNSCEYCECVREWGAKEFILARAALNLAALAKLIDWSPQSMNDWLKGRRGIPEAKLKALEEMLIEYGFERWRNEA
jgi:hypothetical protein